MLINLLPLLEAKDSSENREYRHYADQLFKYAKKTQGQTTPTKRRHYVTERRWIRAFWHNWLADLYQAIPPLSVIAPWKNTGLDIRKFPRLFIGNQTNRRRIVYTPLLVKMSICVFYWPIGKIFYTNENDIDPAD